MADSDDEYAPRRRDKFARERSDFPEKKGRDFSDNRRPPGGGYQQRYDGNKRTGGFQRDEINAKRPRRDWDDSYDPQPARRESAGGGGLSTPVLMTFKQFLASQDDSITDEDAIAKYQEYKLEFKRQELHAFFVAHKEEEWFRLKYHPDDSAKRQEQHLANVRRRLEIFQELSEKGWLKKAKLDHTNGRNLIKLMDALVVKLENGTDDDLVGLDEFDFEDETGGMQENTGGSQAHTSPDRSTEERDKMKIDVKEEPVDDKRTAAPGDEEKEEGEEKNEEVEETQKDNKEDEGTISDSDSEKLSSAEKPPQARVKAEKLGTPEPGKKYMLLHKTSSIFLRNLPPSVTIKEVEELCKRFPGFLRVGLADPLPERRFYRRGWISFRRDVNIKEICWNFNNIRLRECDMGAIVNRDLTRRVRVVNGITPHKQVAQHDLRLAARLVQICDKKAGLFTEATTNGVEPPKPAFELPLGAQLEFGIDSKNPILHNITDYLIEEASAEEEELLGTAAAGNENELKTVLERDEGLLEVLDRIILYLRLVHSVDYYNHGEYPHEDEMPNRCGLVHVRGPPPSPNQWGQDEQGNPMVSLQFVNEFMASFDNRLKPMLTAVDKLPDADVQKLGKKDPEKEVEAFVTANTQELAKDKWLCPLSGKKFKGPEFIRKHIVGKHNDKLDEVRVEVAYFNNYLYDRKRPTNAEKPSSPSLPPLPPGPGGLERGFEREEENRGRQHWNDNRGYDRGYGGGWRDNQRNYGGGGRGYGGGGGFQREGYYRRDGGYGQQRGYNQRQQQQQHWGDHRRDPREPITYKDLDAPEDVY